MAALKILVKYSKIKQLNVNKQEDEDMKFWKNTLVLIT